MYEEKVSYRSEIILALKHFGGQAKLKDIYEFIEFRDKLPYIKTNKKWQDNICNELQTHSSDSYPKLKGTPRDLFYSVKGIGGGYWGLKIIKYDNSTYNYIDNGEFYNVEKAEGFTKTILVNKFERNITLRKKCIEIFNDSCIVCKFNFEKVYGFRGNGFIEVHHLVPLSEIKNEYIATPYDLRPLCSNCHSIVHRFKPFLTIEEITNLYSIRNDNR